MISIDQIMLLQQKVESAVQKIAQLKEENAALRNKCSELTNALSEKSELLSTFEADEKRIEDGILKALNKLDSVENSLLNQANSRMENTAKPVQTSPASPVSEPVKVPSPAPISAETTPVQTMESEEDTSNDSLFSDDPLEFDDSSADSSEPVDIF